MPINYKRYPSNWKSEIRPAILLRENNCCKFCGIRNGAIVYRWKENKKLFWLNEIEYREKVKNSGWHFDFYKKDQIKVVLTIAHLDHDEENINVSYDRLAALCQLCHLRYDAKEKYRRVMLKSFSKGLL